MSWQKPQDLTHKPLLIRDQLILTQSLEASEVEELKQQYPKRVVLNIPAEMAFGTGDHPTTATCLRFLCDYAQTQKESWSMVDVGCGTGVIAMSGFHLGATAVDAFDYDEKAIEVTQKNLTLNNAETVKASTLDVFEWNPKKQYNVVAANLFSPILQKAFPILKSALAPDGRIIVSGILATQWEETKLAAEEAGLEFLEVKKIGKWVSAFGKPYK